MPDLKTTDKQISYRMMGLGPAVVLLHGFPESGSLWRYIWPSLTDKYTIIVPDLPGSGSSPLLRDTSISNMASLVKGILDAEEIDKAVIAGHSMGGYVAFSFAAHFPAMVAGLSLVHSTPMADDDEKIQSRKKAIELVNKGGRVPFLKQAVTNLFSADFKQGSPSLVEEQVNNAMDMDEQSITNFYMAMMQRPDSTNVLSSASFPVQWIFGEEDNIIPYKKIIPLSYTAGINFVSLYRYCAHMSMIEAPDMLSRDLVKFIDHCYQ